MYDFRTNHNNTLILISPQYNNRCIASIRSSGATADQMQRFETYDGFLFLLHLYCISRSMLNANYNAILGTYRFPQCKIQI